jgi:hypothetical protein
MLKAGLPDVLQSYHLVPQCKANWCQHLAGLTNCSVSLRSGKIEIQLHHHWLNAIHY